MKSKKPSKKIIAILAGVMVVTAAFITIFRYGGLVNENETIKDTNTTEALSGGSTNTKNNATEKIVAVITQNSEKVLEYSNSGASEFKYDLKKTYASREELLQERTNLSACYKVFIDNKDNHTVTQATDLYNKLMGIIKEKPKAFPPSNEEVFQEKKKLYDDEMFYRKQFLLEASMKLEADSGNPDRVQQYQDRKNAYEDAQKIGAKYDGKEISIDEALKQLGIEYTTE